jgi:23S rRNA pseudouridine2605 synthase
VESEQKWKVESGRVLVFNKPKGVVVTTSDELGRKSVYDLLPKWVREEDWVAVGRLDRDTKGLLLFVKDHTLVNELGHPGRLEKEYEVFVRGHVQPHHLEQITRGIESPVGLLTCERISIEGYLGPKTRLHVVLKEGKNRHIRRMFGALHDDVFGTPLKVIDLKRIRFGPVPFDVASGEWRLLTDNEIEELNTETQRHRE